jgi:hypothetical protein
MARDAATSAYKFFLPPSREQRKGFNGFARTNAQLPAVAIFPQDRPIPSARIANVTTMSSPRGKIHAGFSLAALALSRWLTSANDEHPQRSPARSASSRRFPIRRSMRSRKQAAGPSEDDSLTPIRPLCSIAAMGCLLKIHEIVNSSALGSAKVY